MMKICTMHTIQSRDNMKIIILWSRHQGVIPYFINILSMRDVYELHLCSKVFYLSLFYIPLYLVHDDTQK